MAPQLDKEDNMHQATFTESDADEPPPASLKATGQVALKHSKESSSAKDKIRMNSP